MSLIAYVKTLWQNGATPAISATNLNKIEDGLDAVTDEVIAHEAESATTAHLIANISGLQTALDGKQAASAELAKFKKGSSTYTDNDTSQTFTDAFCTADSLVTIVITSVTLPQGVWSVESGAGSFTITSTVAESADITFDYYIQKAVG